MGSNFAPIINPKTRSTNLYAQVADAVQDLIRTGALRPGERVASVRRASQQHGVSLSTAIQAYVELENRGLIEARPRSGFYVRALSQVAISEPATSAPARAATAVGVASLQARLFDAVRQPNIVPLGAAYPSPEILPTAKLARCMAAAAREAGPRGVAYDMPPGAEGLRRQIARRALDAGMRLSPEAIITTCGGTEALMLCLRAVTKPGDVIALESPTYFGVLQAVEQLGLKVLEIPMHPRHGMDLDRLETAVASRKVAACLATPNFSNPLGSLMPEAAKQRLVEILARREIPLIEDDINGELFHHEGARPHAAQAYDRAGLVLLCGSFSKTLAPGYRVGWVAAPGRYFERIKALKMTSTLATATLPQLAIAELVAQGGYDYHLRALRRRMAAQMQQMAEAVAAAFPGGTRLTRPAGGFVLWLELPAKVAALELHARALQEGIAIAPGPMFSPRQQFTNFVRLSCGHPWNTATERAVETLGRLTQRLLA